MSRNMCAADMRAAMRRPEGMHPTAAACPEAYSAAVPAKATVPSATVSAKACAVSAATMSAATMSAATPAAGVCFECEKRHDDDHHRGHASAGRQYQLHGAVGLGAPHCRGQLSLATSPRTKSCNTDTGVFRRSRHLTMSKFIKTLSLANRFQLVRSENGARAVQLVAINLTGSLQIEVFHRQRSDVSD
jgi:hypothetical protein